MLDIFIHNLSAQIFISFLVCNFHNGDYPLLIVNIKDRVIHNMLEELVGNRFDLFSWILNSSMRASSAIHQSSKLVASVSSLAI